MIQKPSLVLSNPRRTSNAQTDSLKVNGILCETPEEVCQGWAAHFQNMALPLQNEKFDSDYKRLVDMDIESVSNICEGESKHITPITEKGVQNALNKLKKKTQQSHGFYGTV